MMACLLHVLVTRRAPAKCSSLLVVPAIGLPKQAGTRQGGCADAGGIETFTCRYKRKVSPWNGFCGSRAQVVCRFVLC